MGTSRGSWLTRFLAFWRAYPALMVLLIAGIFGLPIWVKLVANQERALELYYPMSHFPMYSDFTEWDYVIFLTDGQDQVLPMMRTTGGLRVARVKKNFNSELNAQLDRIKQETGDRPRKRESSLQVRQQVGQVVMDYVLEQWQERKPETLASQQELRLYLQDITQSKGKVRAGEPQLVAEWKQQ